MTNGTERAIERAPAPAAPLMQEALQPHSMDEVLRLGKVLASSGFFADAKDTAQAVVKILYGMELGVGPMASMLGVHIINSRPSPSAGLLAGLIRRSRSYDFVILEHDDKACHLEFYRYGRACGKSLFTIMDAQQAGLTSGRNQATWKSYARNMLFARAISNGVRWYCPDLLLEPLTLSGDEVDEIAASDVQLDPGRARTFPDAPPGQNSPTLGQLLAPRGKPTDRADGEFWRRAWFGMVRGTPLDSDDARGDWLEEHTQIRSLRELLAGATNADMEVVLQQVGDAIGKPWLQGQPAPKPTYDDVFPPDDQPSPAPPAAAATSPVAVAPPPVRTEPDPGKTHFVGDDCQPPHPPLPTDEPQPAVDYELEELPDFETTPDQELAIARDWAEQVRLEIQNRPDDFMAAQRPQQRQVSNAVLAAVQGDVDAAKFVMLTLVGDADPAKLSLAATTVLMRRASDAEWAQMLKTLATEPD